MATRIEYTNVTITAGTAIATPLRINADFDDGQVDRIEMRWPPGPLGLVGLRIGHSGQVIIPFSGPTFLVTDDEKISWDVSGFPTGNKWFVDGYNLDVNDHTIQVRWLLSEVPASTPARPALFMTV